MTRPETKPSGTRPAGSEPAETKSSGTKRSGTEPAETKSETKHAPGLAPDAEAPDFIRAIVRADVAAGKHGGSVVTRFPPEPNGYLHIGHAKSICLNFGLADEFGGRCHLRFDDTNPLKEDPEYVDAIQRDVHWLGFDWGKHLYHASDYYETMYRYAVQLVQEEKAYVDSSSEEEIRRDRGTVTESGRESRDRERPVAESLELLEGMRRGDFPDGAYVLRAKIDMASPNMKMRDPLIYRIRRAAHHRTGSAWNIYPMYDFAHCLSDSVEGVTHSLCTLEFENNRELYDWFLEAVRVPHRPQQIEFARLNLSHTVMSKRFLLGLVQKGVVRGWDDPRLPTLAGLRRRGYLPESIRAFCERVGIAKRNNLVDLTLLEYHLREDLNRLAQRVMAVLRPLRVVLENYPEDRFEAVDADNNPGVPEAGTRQLRFGRVLYIERDDFRLEPPPKFYRLAPGREVRLKHAYFIRCERAVQDPQSGEIVELRCTYDLATKSGAATDRRVQGTVHWVEAASALDAEVRLYETLFTVPDPMAASGEEGLEGLLNPESLVTQRGCKVEASLAAAAPGKSFQFLRQGYFVVDPDSRPGQLVFNRTVGLKDSWAKIEKKQQVREGG